MEKVIYVLNFCEILAALSGIWYWKKIRNTCWSGFAWYLIIIVSVELIGKYLKFEYPEKGYNSWLYIFFGIPVQFLFFFWLFSRQMKSKRLIILSLIATIIYLVTWLIDILYLKGMKMWFFSFSYTIGNLLLVILLINYLLRFINSDEILNYKSNMMFWVAIGIAIFYLGTLPFFALRNTLYYQYRDVFTIYNYVQLILGCLMYLVFALSFVWGKPK